MLSVFSGVKKKKTQSKKPDKYLKVILRDFMIIMLLVKLKMVL